MENEAFLYDCVVIGAGISGLMAAQALSKKGFRVRVIDKARGVGGRMCTRRREQASWDHGAQFLSAQTEMFKAELANWEGLGLVKHWSDGFPSTRPKHSDKACYAVKSGMTGIAKSMVKDLELTLSTQITKVELGTSAWEISTESAVVALAKTILFTPPSPQTIELIKNIGGEDSTIEKLQIIKFSPCFALLVELSEKSLIPPPGGLFLGGEPIAWIADNQRKGISEKPAVTIHGGRDYSVSRFDFSKEVVTQELLSAATFYLSSVVGEPQLHRWRYANVEERYPEAWLQSSGHPTLFFAGDGFGLPSVEGAWDSGRAAGNRIVEYLTEN